MRDDVPDLGGREKANQRVAPSVLSASADRAWPNGWEPMDYEQKVKEARIWVWSARQKMRTVQLLIPIDRANDERLREAQWGTEPADAAHDLAFGLSLTIGFLYGVAVENAFRARQAIEGQLRVNAAGEIIGVNKTHDLAQMAGALNMKLPSLTMTLLDTLRVVIRTTGKYPFAKNKDTQQTMTHGVPSAGKYDELKELILLILDRQDLKDEFLRHGT